MKTNHTKDEHMTPENIKNLRKIVCKKHNNKFIWTISLFGEEVEIDDRVSRKKDRKFMGTTLEEAIASLPAEG